MKERPVVISGDARRDLFDIYNFIADAADPVTAIGYVQRIEAFCRALSHGSERGTRRDYLQGGMRTIGFERRATIAFTVTDDEVIVLRIHYGGRDVEL